MRISIKRVALVTLVLALAACKMVLAPPVSGIVESHAVAGTMDQPTELTATQLEAFSAWFSQHSSGWSSSPASYLPTLVVRIKHSNGDSSVVNVLVDSVVVNNREGQYVHQFSTAELSALRRTVGLQ